MYWNACAPIGTFGARWRERSEASAITIRIFPMGRIRLTSMGPGITAVRKYSVTHRKARGSIRDAIRRGSDWHGLHRIPRGDGPNRPLGSRTTRAADRDPFRRAHQPASDYGIRLLLPAYLRSRTAGAGHRHGE